MKQAIVILFLSVLGQLSMATEKVKLPEEPWRYIVEMMRNCPINMWEDNVSIKLWGNYTESDSAMIENSIKTLNELTTTIKLSLSTNEVGNLNLYFLDSTNIAQFSQIFPYQNPKTYHSTWKNKFNIEKRSSWLLSNFQSALLLDSIPEVVKQYYLTNKIAYALFPYHLFNEKYFDSNNKYNGPASIYNSITPSEIKPYYSELGDFDKQIIKTVYAPDFNQLLPLAKKQFRVFEIPEWVRNHSHEILVFPFVLAVFLLVGLFILLYRKLFSRIRDKWAQFNAILTLALPLLGILIAAYFMTALSLKYPLSSHYNLSNLIAGILITCTLGLPALNLIRMIEVIVNQKHLHKYLKVLLLFLSTSIIPSATLLVIAYYVTNKRIGSQEIQALIIVFLAFVFIGIIRALISFFILKEKEIKIETEVKLANLRELKTKAELNALHSRINPHFLYNSLNSIAGLAKSDAEKTEHMALSLSKLFRYSINKEQSDWTTFAEEMEMVNVYLDIEKVRFDDRLEFSIDLPNELKTAKIPRFIIQPLVENAIKHGISQLVTKGKIAVTISKNASWIEISVHDNGPRFPEEMAPGFGLQSIYDKLEILYPNRFELHFVNSPQKQVLIKLK